LIKKSNPILFTPDIAYNNSYKKTLKKINDFSKDYKDYLITFIIPSVNRKTLNRALISLKNQKIDNWKAIIIFDGCEPNNPEIISLLSDKRILYISINKKGKLRENGHSSAGFVRNIGMSIVKTPYIGFLDDDDIILENYTEKLIEEIKLNPKVDLISFRMINNNNIIPSESTNSIIMGQIGISFCYKTKLFQKGHMFKQSQIEDFDLINEIKNKKGKIILSPYITYLVGDSENIINNNIQRTIIN
jgi:cellulose synthase/poly-beta-1,6-N-acetylglucosamine synthase-like glycosyltransferase